MMHVQKVEEILLDIDYPFAEIGVFSFQNPKEFYIQVSAEREHVVRPGTFLCKGRKWRLSEHMTKSEIVQTALKAVLAFEEHEVRENFKYRGQAIFDPHYDVDALYELRKTNPLDERE